MNYLLAVTLFLLSFCLYLHTCCPSIYWGDAGEIITTAYILGIPHQPGYPLYNLLTKLFFFLPIDNIAFKANLLSGFLSALTISILFFIILKLLSLIDKLSNTKINTFISFITSSVFALSHTFFLYSTFACVYPLFILLFGFLFLIALNFYEKKYLHYLLLLSFTYSIALTNHLLILPLSTALLFIVIVTQYKLVFNLRNLILILLLFLLPLSIYYYLPLRAASSPVINWGNPSYFTNFIFTITLQQPAKIPELFIMKQWIDEHKLHIASIRYINILLFLLPIYLSYLFVAKIPNRRKKYTLYFITALLSAITFFAFFILLNLIPWYHKTVKLGFHPLLYIEYLYNQYFIIGFLFIIIGFLTLIFKKEQKLIIFLVFLFLLSIVFVILHLYPSNRPQLEEKFHLPGYFTLSIFIAIGIRTIIYNLKKFTIPLLILLIFYPMIYLNANYKIIDKKNYYFVEDYVNNILKSCDRNSVIFINGEDALFPIWYLHYVEKKREDLNIIYLGGLTQKWYVESKMGKNMSRYSQKEIVNEILRMNKNKKIYYTGTKTLPQGLINENLLIPEGIVSRIKKENEKINITKQINTIENNIYKKYRYRGMYDKYIEAKVKALKSIYATAHLQLGLIYQKINNINKAIDEFNKALLLDNTYSLAYQKLAEIYLNKKQLKKAEYYYRKAVQVDEGNVVIRNQLGLIYYQQGKYTDALEEFKTCINIFPQYPEARYNLSMCYLTLNNTNLAIAELKKVIEIEPEFVDAYIQLSRIYNILGNSEKARYYLNKANQVKK